MSREKEVLDQILIKMHRILDQYLALDEKYRELAEQKIKLEKDLHHTREVLGKAEEKIRLSKMSQGFALSDHDQQEIVDRIDEYIKEIDRCIGLLSE